MTTNVLEARLKSQPNLLPADNPEIVARVRRDGVILQLSVTHPESLPVAPEKLIGLNIKEIITQANANNLLRLIEETLESRSPQTMRGQFLPDFNERTHELCLIAVESDEVLAIARQVPPERNQIDPEAQSLNRALISLQSAAAAISLSLDHEQVLESLTWELTDLLNANGCAVYDWDQENNCIEFVKSFLDEDPTRYPAAQILDLPSCPIANRALKEHGAQQLFLDGQSMPFPEYEYMRQCGVETLLLFPLMFQDHTFGLAEIVVRNENRVFSEQEISLGQLLCNQAGITMANSRLHEETQLRLKEQTALRKASEIFSSTLEHQTILKHIAEQMGRALNVTSVYMCTYNARSSLSKVVAEYYGPDASEREKVSDLGKAYAEGYTDSDYLMGGKPEVWHVDDPDLGEIERKHLQDYGGKSVLGVPVTVIGRVTAFAELWESRYKRFFAPEEIALAQDISQMAAVALENTRLYEQLQHRLKELAALSRVSQSITSTLDLQETLNVITDHALELFQGKAALIALMDDSRKVLHVVATAGNLPRSTRGQKLDAVGGVLGRIVQAAEPVVVNEVSEENRHFPHFKNGSRFEVNSILSVPLRTKGRVLGVLVILNKVTGPFIDEDMRLLSNLATSAATAIENGRLYQLARQEISERKRAEERLQDERAKLATRVAEQTSELRSTNVELAHASRMKDEFLASMSHELRTPLNAILGISEGLQEQIYGPLDERQNKALSMVEQSGRHLLDLINDILDVAKFESGEMLPDFRSISVAEVCEASLQFITQSASKKRIQVYSHFDNQVDYIRADSRRLKQILINLLTNAVKFSREEGSIGLDVKGDPENKVVKIVVWDNGIGIAPESRDRLFKPFVQLDSKLSRQYSGTGLGLALVKRLTEMHGGSVDVESEVGKGTRFIVTLPWKRTEPLLDGSSAFAGRRARIERQTGLLGQNPAQGSLVLLAEDDDINGEIFAHAIESMGFQVQVVRDGSEAVAFSRSALPSLILMDIQMPGMDGLEAIRRIRAYSDTSSVPIVALTALAMAGDRELCLEAGADDYLSKPVSLKTLEKTIREHLNGMEAAQEDINNG